MSNYFKEKIEELIGKEYIEVLEEACKIREERKLKYGDSFMKSTYQNLLVMAKEKILRFETCPYPDDDDLVDVINYVVFAIANKRKYEKL